MLTANDLKFIKQLQNKKYRQEFSSFLVEGAKMVSELVASGSFEIQYLLITEKYLEKYGNTNTICHIVNEQTLERAGTFATNNGALAVAKIPREIKPDIAQLAPISLVLDQISDPGNLGTIIRIADWYGLNSIYCMNGTAEWYSPKVIAASMGSFLRVKPYFIDYHQFENIFKDIPVVTADLSGTPLKEFKKPDRFCLVMGSESQGISDSIQKLAHEKVTIEKFGSAESLNVGVATAVILSWVR